MNINKWEHINTQTAISIFEDLQETPPEIDVNAMGNFLEFIGVTKDIMDLQSAYFSTFGLSQGKFGLLMHLYRNDCNGLSPYELAEKSGVTRGTVTTLLDRLEKLNYICRDKHPNDRRMLIVRLTDTGRKFLKGMLPNHFKRSETIMKNLTSEECCQLLRLATKVRTSISKL